MAGPSGARNSSKPSTAPRPEHSLQHNASSRPHHDRKATGWCASDCPEEDPVKDAQGNLVLGRTRWRRFAAVLTPAVAAVGLMVVGIANGAVPLSFAVSGSTFKVSADSLDGTGFVQY